ncbi:MAG: HAD hydrolase-like protein [Methyloceanibacter sp.]
MNKDSTIVFDLDGTLVDTLPDLSKALNDVIVRRGYAPVSAEAIRPSVAGGAKVMIEAALGGATAERDLDQLLVEFIAYYEANIAVDSRPFPGVVEALERLASAGARLAVCTNKREQLTRKLLQALELDRYFCAIAGRDTLACAKPDPRHLTGVISLAGGDCLRAILVGDSDVDLRTAKAADIPVILVTFGYGPTSFDSLVADAVIDHFSELESCALSLLREM